MILLFKIEEVLRFSISLRSYKCSDMVHCQEVILSSIEECSCEVIN